jgi:hypothetical protein
MAPHSSFEPLYDPADVARLTLKTMQRRVLDTMYAIAITKGNTTAARLVLGHDGPIEEHAKEALHIDQMNRQDAIEWIREQLDELQDILETLESGDDEEE